jgi:hypothetical protein
MSQTRKNTIAPDARILVHIKKLLLCSAFHSRSIRRRIAVTRGRDGMRQCGIRNYRNRPQSLVVEVLSEDGPLHRRLSR